MRASISLSQRTPTRRLNESTLSLKSSSYVPYVLTPLVSRSLKFSLTKLSALSLVRDATATTRCATSFVSRVAGSIKRSRVNC